jgi:hypothetical protein
MICGCRLDRDERRREVVSHAGPTPERNRGDRRAAPLELRPRVRVQQQLAAGRPQPSVLDPARRATSRGHARMPRPGVALRAIPLTPAAGNMQTTNRHPPLPAAEPPKPFTAPRSRRCAAVGTRDLQPSGSIARAGLRVSSSAAQRTFPNVLRTARFEAKIRPPRALPTKPTAPVAFTLLFPCPPHPFQRRPPEIPRLQAFPAMEPTGIEPVTSCCKAFDERGKCTRQAVGLVVIGHARPTRLRPWALVCLVPTAGTHWPSLTRCGGNTVLEIDLNAGTYVNTPNGIRTRDLLRERQAS